MVMKAAAGGAGLLAAALAVLNQVKTSEDGGRPAAARADDGGQSGPLLNLRDTLDRARSTEPSSAEGEPGLREPADEFAKAAVDSIARAEKEWEDDWQRFDQALQGQTKNFDLFKEAEFIEALRKISRSLMAQSKEMLDRYVSLGKNNEKLKEALRKAPAYLREAAREYEAYAKATKTPEVAESYQALSDLWASRATIIEKRGDDAAKYYDPAMVEFLEDWHQFFRRLTPMLDSYSSTIFESGEHQRFNERMKGYLKRLDQLHESLKQMRLKAMEQAENVEVRSVLLADKQAEEQRRRDELRVEAERLHAARMQAHRAYLQQHAVSLGYRGEPEQALARYREKAKGRGGEPLPGQSIPIVRLGYGSGRIEQVASLTLGGTPTGPVTASLPPGADVGDYLLPPDVDHPSSFVGESLRSALASIRAGNEKIGAVVLARRAEIERITKLQLAFASVLKDHAHLIWRDATKGPDGDFKDNRMFIKSDAIANPYFGAKVYFYGEDDLLRGIVKAQGSVALIGYFQSSDMAVLGRPSIPLGDINKVGSRIAVVTPAGLARLAELGRLSRAGGVGRPETIQGLL